MRKINIYIKFIVLSIVFILILSVITWIGANDGVYTCNGWRWPESMGECPEIYGGLKTTKICFLTILLVFSVVYIAIIFIGIILIVIINYFEHGRNF